MKLGMGYMSAVKRGVLEQTLRGSAIWQQFRLSWPDWQVRFWRLPEGGEVIDWDDRIIWLDAACEDPVWALAHASAHLLFCTGGRTDRFSVFDELEADRLADAWVATLNRQQQAG